MSQSRLDFERELQKITEAYCVENNIPIRRRFTHEELELSIERVRQAAAMQRAVEVEGS